MIKDDEKLIDMAVKLSSKDLKSTLNANDTVVVTMEDGSVGRIKSIDLAEVLVKSMPIFSKDGKGVSDNTSFKNRGVVSIQNWLNMIELNNATETGIYRVTTKDASIWGSLLVFNYGSKSHGSIIQFLIKPDAYLKYRCNKSSEDPITSSWQTIQLS